MFSQQIQLRGHIIDSLILPKVLDEILTNGGQFTIREVKIGQQRTDPSHATIDVFAATPEAVDNLVGRLRQHGAEVVKEMDVQLAEAPADGVFPDNFYVTTNQQTFVHVDGQWIEVTPATMDSGACVDLKARTATTVKFSGVRKGMKFAVGHRGIRVMPVERALDRHSVFEFMASSVSSEKPKSAIIREVAAEFRLAKKSGGKILVVAGPAVVHTGAGEHFEKLIQWGYVDLLFAGNALATHDIENALYGTSLGVYLERGALADEGHENHMRAINTIRACGGIRPAVKQGVLKSGIMFQCVQRNVDFVLAGSIRDDGPLPDVITDVVEAQKVMRTKVGDVTIALMMGTLLHSIAVGNLLRAAVKTICVDINPSVVTKLADRGTFQAIGLVTDIEPFLRELTEFLAEEKNRVSLKRELLLCPPDHYGIEYEINPWMKREHKADSKLAASQWAGLRDKLRALGCDVQLMAAQPKLPDLVFTANAGLLVGKKFIPSHFRHPERQGEEPHFIQWFANRGCEIVQLPDEMFFEGEGDALFSGEALFCGYKFRSDIRAHQFIADQLKCLVISVELVDDRFYHLDTCFCPLNADTAMWFPGAFDDYGQRAIRNHIPQLIAVEPDEAIHFACNAVVLGRDIALPEGCPKLYGALANHGFQTHALPMTEFIKAGGACKCLTLFLRQR